MDLKTKRNKFILVMIALAALFTLGFALIFMNGCAGSDPLDNKLMLYLNFDEGSGNKVKDSAKKVPDATVRYVFSDAQYQPQSQDPQWREKGVKKGSLLFDGYSNFIRYDYDDIKVRGSEFSISAYVAPRAFEWDDPNAQENGTDRLTAIVSQMDKSAACGFILGYHRHGNWSFQVGDGDNWISVWNDEAHTLKKYEWNHVVASYDGKAGEMSIYLNGELAGKKSFIEGSKIAAAVDEPLCVAKNADNPYSNATASGNMVSGLMDELKLYKAVATAKDAKRLYEKYELPEIAFEDIWLQNVLTEDYQKTQLHGGPYQHWMNEPHAPMYYNGKYHLFFQFNLVGPYFHNICWGHLVSDDMVNWKPLKEVITPTAGTVAPDGVWSGGVTYDKNGVPVIFFTAGNDSYRNDGLISNQNVGVAYPKDLSDPELTEWVVCDELAIKQVSGQGRTGEFRDMHVWKEDNTWCMLIGTGSTSTAGGTAILYTATALEVKDGVVDMNWTYRGSIYQMKNQPADLGKVWELPVVLPVQNEAKTIKKYIFVISPAPADSADNKIYYFLGNFNLTTGKFTPDADFDNNPHLLDYGCNVFTGPSGFIDPVSGNAYIMSIMQDQRSPGVVAASGWANCVGFTRRVWLNDDGTDVKLAPVEALENYESATLVSTQNKTVAEANAALAGKGSDMVYVRVTFRNESAASFGIRVKKNASENDLTSFTYNAASGTITGSTMNKGGNASSTGGSGALSLNADGTLTMEIYIDRSLVEAYFNQTKAITIRSYADFASTDIELFAEGGDVSVQELYVASLKSIYKS